MLAAAALFEACWWPHQVIWQHSTPTFFFSFFLFVLKSPWLLSAELFASHVTRSLLKLKDWIMLTQGGKSNSSLRNARTKVSRRKRLVIKWIQHMSCWKWIIHVNISSILPRSQLITFFILSKSCLHTSLDRRECNLQLDSCVAKHFFKMRCSTTIIYSQFFFFLLLNTYLSFMCGADWFLFGKCHLHMWFATFARWFPLCPRAMRSDSRSTHQFTWFACSWLTLNLVIQF